MSIARNEQALIALVEEDAERKRSEMLGAARSDAEAIVRSAHVEARAAMRRAFEDERRLERQRVGAAEANLETRRRLALQRRNAALVAAAWPLLPAAFVARWRDPRTRQLWVDDAADHACAALPKAAWAVAHPVDWPAAERERLASRIASHCGKEPLFVPDATVQAGLRITADGTSVDATIAALLADRNEIAGQLLHRFARLDHAAGGDQR
jgi:hypothetical protein